MALPTFVEVNHARPVATNAVAPLVVGVGGSARARRALEWAPAQVGNGRSTIVDGVWP